MRIPLSFGVREAAGCRLVGATFAQAAELADLLAGPADETIVVLDIATTSFLDERFVPYPPSWIAAEQGVACEVHQLGSLARNTVGLSEEALVLRSGDLSRLLDGWSPYELTLVRCPRRPSADQLDAIALAAGTAGPDEPVLPDLPGCTLWYSGHDDMFLWVESADPAVPPALLARLLALLAGGETPDAPVALAEALLAHSPNWVATLSPDETTVQLAATGERWRFSTPLPGHVDRTATFTPAWRLH